jgi:hypothetical protein
MPLYSDVSEGEDGEAWPPQDHAPRSPANAATTRGARERMVETLPGFD